MDSSFFTVSRQPRPPLGGFAAGVGGAGALGHPADAAVRARSVKSDSPLTQ
jgi:hypothetical protein